MAERSPKASVLMVTYEYARAACGGAARQAQCLAEGLAARGRRVGVVTARHPGVPAFERVGGVEVHRVWAIPKPRTFSATFLPSLARFLLLHGWRYDVWHAHQAFYNAAVALTIAPTLRRRCVVKAAASGPFGDVARLQRVPVGQWVINRLRRADAIISLNADLTSELLAVGVPPARIRVIANGVDCTRYSPPTDEQRTIARLTLGVPRDATIAVFAGRLAEDKGVDFLIDAWRAVEAMPSTSSCHLLVAGDGPRAVEYRERAARGLQRIKFLGKMPDVLPVLHAADLVVHPSLAEGISNLVLEAMATGLPVIGTLIGGLTDQIQNGITGLLVPPRNGYALAAAIVTAMADPYRRAAMGAAAREVVESRFGLAAMVDSYEALYAGLVLTDGQHGNASSPL